MRNRFIVVIIFDVGANRIGFSTADCASRIATKADLKLMLISLRVCYVISFKSSFNSPQLHCISYKSYQGFPSRQMNKGVSF